MRMLVKEDSNHVKSIDFFSILCVFFSHLSGLNEKSKGNDAFIDLQPGNNRLDKVRQEKLKRFRESIHSKNSSNDDKDDNRTLFSLAWKDNGEYQHDDPDYQRYLRTLNAAIFLRIKTIHEHRLEYSLKNHLKYFEQILYNETLIHLHQYSKLAAHTCLGFENFVENNKAFKQWFTSAHTNEHYPLMILGNRASGKTLLATKLVQYHLNSLGKSSQTIIRYFNLTSRSKTISEIFTSICLQMSTFANVSAIANKHDFNRIEYYQNALQILSKSQKPVIIMIDGIEEVTPSSQHSSSLIFYQTLLQILPPKVNQIEHFYSRKRNHFCVGLCHSIG